LKIRFERFPVLHDHAFDAQLLQPVGGRRHTDQSSAELGHEIDRLRRRVFGGHDQIAFVFPVGIVHHNHHLAFAQVFNDPLDGIKRVFHRLPINLSGPWPTASNKTAIRRQTPGSRTRTILPWSRVATPIQGFRTVDATIIMQSDDELLRSYSQDRSEGAFSETVVRGLPGGPRYFG
jgi:hypothetical protein